MSRDSKANPKVPKTEIKASQGKEWFDRFVELFMNSIKTRKGK